MSSPGRPPPGREARTCGCCPCSSSSRSWPRALATRSRRLPGTSFPMRRRPLAHRDAPASARAGAGDLAPTPPGGSLSRRSRGGGAARTGAARTRSGAGDGAGPRRRHGCRDDTRRHGRAAAVCRNRSRAHNTGPRYWAEAAAGARTMAAAIKPARCRRIAVSSGIPMAAGCAAAVERVLKPPFRQPSRRVRRPLEKRGARPKAAAPVPAPPHGPALSGGALPRRCAPGRRRDGAHARPGGRGDAARRWCAYARRRRDDGRHARPPRRGRRRRAAQAPRRGQAQERQRRPEACVDLQLRTCPLSQLP